MSYSNIKRFLSAALIVVFAAPAALAAYEYSSAYSEPGMTLAGDVKLTDSNDTITLSLRDSDIKQVLRMFADKAGMNIIFHDSVKGNVTLDLVRTPLNEAFNLILQIAGLNYYKQGNTMIIIAKASPANAVYAQQQMMTFPVKYVSASKIADFLNNNVFSTQSGVNSASVNSATNELVVFGLPSDVPIIEKVINQFDKVPYSRTFAVNHTTPAEMADMICNLLLPSSGMTSSSSGGSGKKGGGIKKPSPVEGVITGEAASVSSSGSEIKLGEGVIACTSTADAGNSAFDTQSLSIAYFPQRGTITVMGGSPAQARMIESFIKANDIKQPQAYLEVSIVELDEQGSKEFQNIWNLGSKHWQANFDGQSFSGGRPGGKAWLQKNEYMWDGGSNGIYEMSGGTDSQPTLVGWEGGTPNGVPYILNGVLNIPNQMLRTSMSQVPSLHINWMMHYLIENRKARVLANPKILITNGQESTIDLTQDYVEKVTSEYLTSSLVGTGTTGTVQRNYTIGDDLGIKVTLTPFISPEGYVTLNITPSYSTVSGEVRRANSTGTSDLEATLLSRRDLDLKNVRIKDGETLVLGGLIQETEQKTVHKIPLLGDLPLVGTAFRSTATTKTKNELVIMITPKIINDGEGSVADSV